MFISTPFEIYYWNGNMECTCFITKVHKVHKTYLGKVHKTACHKWCYFPFISLWGQVKGVYWVNFLNNLFIKQVVFVNSLGGGYSLIWALKCWLSIGCWLWIIWYMNGIGQYVCQVECQSSNCWHIDQVLTH